MRFFEEYRSVLQRSSGRMMGQGETALRLSTTEQEGQRVGS